MKHILFLLFIFFFSFLINAEDGIKIKDLNNNERSTPDLNGTSSITPQQMEELNKNIEIIKDNNKKSEEVLKDLDNDE